MLTEEGANVNMGQITYTVYRLYNTVTGKSYIGLTKDLNVRLAHHKLRSSSCRYLRGSIQKHGWAAFEVHKELIGLTLDEAVDAECRLIAELGTLVPKGYNLTTGGERTILSEETRRRMSVAKKGVPQSQAARDAHSRARTGVKLPPDRVQRMSDIRRGKPSKRKGISFPQIGCVVCHYVCSTHVFNRHKCDAVKRQQTVGNGRAHKVCNECGWTGPDNVFPRHLRLHQGLPYHTRSRKMT